MHFVSFSKIHVLQPNVIYFNLPFCVTNDWGTPLEVHPHLCRRFQKLTMKAPRKKAKVRLTNILVKIVGMSIDKFILKLFDSFINCLSLSVKFLFTQYASRGID